MSIAIGTCRFRRASSRARRSRNGSRAPGSKSASPSWTRWGSTSTSSASTISGGGTRRTRGWRARFAITTTRRWRKRRATIRDGCTEWPRYLCSFPISPWRCCRRPSRTGRAASPSAVTSAVRASRRPDSIPSGQRSPRWASSCSCTRTAPPTSSRTAGWPAVAGWEISSAIRSRRRSFCRA